MLISDFPLQWRWTEEKYDKLPDDHLSRIIPANTDMARSLWERSLTLSDGKTEFRPSTELFDFVSELDKPHSTDRTEKWIRDNFQTKELNSIKVWVSWQPDLAVQTDMEIIAQYWDTFCYEASDDTSIFPELGEWIIHYWHEDRFYFATKSEQMLPADARTSRG